MSTNRCIYVGVGLSANCEYHICLGLFYCKYNSAYSYYGKFFLCLAISYEILTSIIQIWERFFPLSFSTWAVMKWIQVSLSSISCLKLRFCSYLIDKNIWCCSNVWQLAGKLLHMWINGIHFIWFTISINPVHVKGWWFEVQGYLNKFVLPPCNLTKNKDTKTHQSFAASKCRFWVFDSS